MKLWVCSLALLGFSPVMAAEPKKSDTQGQFEMELEIRPGPPPYTFENYLNDLTDLARFDRPAPENPVRQLESRKEQKYEPLNPIILRW